MKPANAKEDKDIREDGNNPVSVGPSESPVKVMSSADSFVADLVKEQPSLEQIASMTVVTNKVVNPLEFPEECMQFEKKKYRFAWLNKDKELDIKLRTTGWVLCTRTSAPFLKSSRFGTHGAVERGGMLLAFMPEEKYSYLFERRPAELSRSKIKYYTDDIIKKYDKDAPVGLYKPEETKE